MTRDIAVLKLGGSLFDLPDLRERFQALTEACRRRTESISRWVIIAGGGPAADVVRGWDHRHQLGEVPSHQLALWSLGLTARFLVHLLPDATLVGSRLEAQRAWNQGRHAILDVPRFLEDEEARLQLPIPFFPAEENLAASNAVAVPAAGEPLPPCWETTSDSIAAWITLRWPAATLLLAKSTGLSPADQASAAEVAGMSKLRLPRGGVDPIFPSLAHAISQLYWVDLRHEHQDFQLVDISSAPLTTGQPPATTDASHSRTD